MALFKSKQIVAKAPIPSVNAATDLVCIFGDYTMAGTEATSDVIEMVPLPAGFCIVDVIVDTEDLGTTVTANVGLLSGDFDSTGARTCGATIMSGKALGTAGVYRADVSAYSLTAPISESGSTTGAQGNRGIGFALSSVSTPTAGAKVRMMLLARPAINSL